MKKLSSLFLTLILAFGITTLAKAQFGPCAFFFTGITQSNSSCTGTTLTATASGSYLWSDGQTTQSANFTSNGTYSVTVTNSSGCTASMDKTVTLIQPTANPIANQILCPGDSAAPIIFSGNAENYHWTVIGSYGSIPGLFNAIGGSSSGKGNIPSFKASNNTNAPVTVTFTVTPVSKEPIAYIANRNGAIGMLNFYDHSEQAIQNSLQLGATDIISNPQHTKLYAANYFDNSISVISNGAIVATVPILSAGNHPVSLAINPAGDRLYVTNSDGIVRVMDLTSNTFVLSIPITGFFNSHLVVTPDGSRLYIVDGNSSNIYVYNIATNALSMIQMALYSPQALTISPDGSKLYVANNGNGGTITSSVAVISTGTNTLTQNINIGAADLKDICITPDGSKVYVISDGSTSRVCAISTATNSILGFINVGIYPKGLTLNSDGSRLYVLDDYDRLAGDLYAYQYLD